MRARPGPAGRRAAGLPRCGHSEAGVGRAASSPRPRQRPASPWASLGPDAPPAPIRSPLGPGCRPRASSQPDPLCKDLFADKATWCGPGWTWSWGHLPPRPAGTAVPSGSRASSGLLVFVGPSVQATRALAPAGSGGGGQGTEASPWTGGAGVAGRQAVKPHPHVAHGGCRGLARNWNQMCPRGLGLRAGDTGGRRPGRPSQGTAAPDFQRVLEREQVGRWTACPCTAPASPASSSCCAVSLSSQLPAGREVPSHS